MKKLAPALMFHLAAALAAAVAPITTVHETEADFAAGELMSVAVTNTGQMSLAGAVEVLMPSNKAPAFLSCLALLGQDVYAGDGLAGRVFRIAGGKAEPFVKVPGTIVTSLRAHGQRLLVGTGGAGAGLYSIDPKTRQVDKVWADPKVKYVWSILPAGHNGLYAATGPEGKLFFVDAAGKADLLYHAKDLADNIRCLAADKGKLYAGTDKHGLVLLIDPAARTGRVLMDATEPEVTSLIVGPAGEVYAATAAGSAEGPAPAGPMAPGPPTKPAPPPKAAPPPPAAEGRAPATAPAAAPATMPAAAPAAMAARPLAEPGPPPPAGGPGGEGPADAATQDPNVPKDAASAGTPVPPVGGPGNAVYCITPDGLVRTVFRRPVSILSMALRDDELILGTGNDGKIFSVTTAGDRSVLLADMEARRIPALLVRPDGAILLATGNAGAVCLLSRTPAPKGTFTAKPVDAGQVARWGAAQIDADVPAGAALTISTRTGNVQTPDEKTWSAWTGPLPLTGRFHKIASPAGRFMQYRLAFAPQPKGASPLVRSVSVVSQVGNLPPWIAAASVSPSATPDESDRDAVKAAGRKVFRVVRVQAVDPNGDVLQFRFEYRPAGAEGWIELAKDVAAPLYAWNTLMVADGAYELRITVSDKASNPPDQALQVTHVGLRTLVDHTPPVIATLAARLEGQTVTVSGAVHDAISRITSIYYSLDSQDPWVPVLPTDGICDDQAEDFRFTLKAVTPGTHQITVRVRDSCGNVAYQTLPVAVQK